MVFIRGQIGAKPAWVREIDFSEERAAIQKNWIDTGKMLSFKFLTDGYTIIGPKFMGASDTDGLTLDLYIFPTQELFMEWALGAPEHIAAHTKLVNAMREAMQSGNPMPMPQAQYHFHATDDKNADIPTIRSQLRDMYRKIEATDWAKAPAPGFIQMMMLGDDQ